jgi:hypothetical protein
MNPENQTEVMGPHDLRTEQGAVDLMSSSRDITEYNMNATQVKQANGGKWPEFWYMAIEHSKMLDKLMEKWAAAGSNPEK